MLDINLLRTNPELVKENIRKKFQDEKLVMVDEVVEMDKEYRAAIQQADTLRNQIKVASKQIGMLMGKGQKEEAEKAKKELSSAPSAQLNLPFIAVGKDGPHHLDIALSRPQFEMMTGDLLARTVAPVQKAMYSTKTAALSTMNVVIVSGCWTSRASGCCSQNISPSNLPGTSGLSITERAKAYWTVR